MDFIILRQGLKIGRQIDGFIDRVSESGLLFKQGMEAYITANRASFLEKLEKITETERQGDALRRTVKEQIFARTLIPESRSDILELLEDLDSLLDRFKAALWRFEIEQPDIFPEFIEDFREMTACVIEAVDALGCAARAFFESSLSVKDHIHKVSFWEKQSDTTAIRLQRNIFQCSRLRLSEKLQLSNLVRHVDNIADSAEDVADKVNIYVIKRML